jgi:capsular exopolysaccharide synthesis family protein
VLLMDADFRRPRVHKYFGLSAKVGLASVIEGQVEAAEAIQQTAVVGLSVLPCGPRPSNPAELLTSPRFEEVLLGLKERYDFLLIDTPPLLAVSDPAVVAPRVDGVLMTIRVGRNSRPYAERAKEILAALGANVLGVVVNGVGRTRADGYHDGAHGYGYNYSYGAYAYAYGEGANSYYQETGTDSSPEFVLDTTGSGSAVELGARPVNGDADHDSSVVRRKQNAAPPSRHKARGRRGRLFGWLPRWWD